MENTFVKAHDNKYLSNKFRCIFNYRIPYEFF